MNNRVFNKSGMRERRKLLRNNSTSAEDILWGEIRRKQILNTKFRRQVSIGNYVIDFFTFEFNLAIEIDGKNHQKIEQKSFDAERQKIMEENNIVFLRFTNEQVKKNLKIVLMEIARKIQELRNIKATPFFSPCQGE
jgi:very-short-patch-repair endonuclease